MIQRLKRKFIATNMLLVSLVLLAVFGVQSFSVYRQATGQVERVQRQALEWVSRDFSPQFVFERFRAADTPAEESAARPLFLERVQSFPGVPVFAVEVDEKGTVTTLRSTPGVEVTEETAQAMAAEALARGGESGRLPGQGLSYLYRQENGRRFLSFADNSAVSAALRRQLLVSAGVGAAALLAFFLISWFLAKLSLRPTQEAWDRQRQFVADASHELKTPLTVALSNVDMLLAQPADLQGDKGRRRLDITKVELLRLRELVEDMLTLARADAQKPEQAEALTETVDLSYLLTCAVAAFEPTFFDCGKMLESQIEPDLFTQGDSARLRELTDILLDNARKYSADGSTVSVTLGRGDKALHLTVSNLGRPLSREEQSHIFERFYRVDQSRGEVSGFGLGLPIAREIVTAHGGKIWAQSDQTGKTTFHVELPPHRG